MSPETEVWLLVISLGAAIVPWAFSIHAKVAVIADTIQSLPRMLEELKATLKEHEVRLDYHEQEIKAIKATPRTD